MLKNYFHDCKSEQQFKMAWIKYHQNELAETWRRQDCFCIETEETVHGFPDVLCIENINGRNLAYFYEFKISDSAGNIRFQSTQPAFYRKHKDMMIQVVALNVKSGEVHIFPASAIFEEKSPYHINEFARVNLNKAEVENESTYSKS